MVNCAGHSRCRAGRRDPLLRACERSGAGARRVGLDGSPHSADRRRSDLREIDGDAGFCAEESSGARTGAVAPRLGHRRDAGGERGARSGPRTDRLLPWPDGPQTHAQGDMHSGVRTWQRALASGIVRIGGGKLEHVADAGKR